MADEVEREVTDEDVEGQVLKSRIRNRTDDESAPSAERRPTMSDSEDDVEGQMFVRTRLR